jgi:hypothetical protein
LATPITTTTSLPPDCVPVDELSASGNLLAFRGPRHSFQTAPPSPLAPTTFAAYIAILPLWDRRLLQQVTIPDADALKAYLLSDQYLYVVSDGGAAKELGSFGAVLASDDTIFVTLSGSTEGATPGSFRAESYGCLAIFRLLLHFCHYYYQLDTIGTLNNFFCDNLGLVTRLNHAAGPLQPFPRHFLRSDIDLELQILETIRLLDLSLSYTHVLGHQDAPGTPPTSAKPAKPLSRQAS